MGINRRMENVMLEKRVNSKNPLGGFKEEWKAEKEIVSAIYPVTEAITVATARFSTTTHFALTKEEIKSGKYRLIKDNKIYLATSFIKGKKFNQILLEEIDSDV